MPVVIKMGKNSCRLLPMSPVQERVAGALLIGNMFSCLDVAAAFHPICSAAALAARPATRPLCVFLHRRCGAAPNSVTATLAATAGDTGRRVVFFLDEDG